MRKAKCILTAILLSIFIICPAHSKGLRILYIGDSITDGNWGGGNKPSEERNHGDWNHLYGSGYMYLCVAHFMGYYPEKEYVFLNRGISGNTLKDLEKRWKKDALNLQPDILSVLVGINDVNKYIQGETETFDIQEWETTYRTLLQQMKKQNPDIKIVLGTPFVGKSDRSYLQDNIEKYIALLQACSEVVKRIGTAFQATILDYQELFHNLQEKYPATPDNYWLWDGIHPTPAGHRQMADVWIKEAGRLLVTD